ncbi:MAG TPA: shikimate kinase [Anaerovoracaceae bacterium]|nr:shikimate kinase [Anaerovoracaceae bacterium]
MGAMPNRIFLIGYMGSGKTTVSKILSKMTGSAYIDMDQEIEKAEGMPIRKMFIKFGEHEFRNKESELLDKLCHVANAVDIMAGESTGTQRVLDKVSKYKAFAERKENLIVSCGGGIILDDLNRKILNRQYTIFLEAMPETLFQRVNGDTNRPFAFMDVNDETERLQKFLELYKKRKPLYQEAASLTIQTDGKSPEEIAGEILDQLKNNK